MKKYNNQSNSVLGVNVTKPISNEPQRSAAPHQTSVNSSPASQDLKHDTTNHNNIYKNLERDNQLEIGNLYNLSKSVKSNGQKITDLAKCTSKSDNNRKVLKDLQKQVAIGNKRKPVPNQDISEILRYVNSGTAKIDSMREIQKSFYYQMVRVLKGLKSDFEDNRVFFDHKTLDSLNNYLLGQKRMSFKGYIRAVTRKQINQKMDHFNDTLMKASNSVFKINNDLQTIKKYFSNLLLRLYRPSWLLLTVIGLCAFAIIPMWLHYFYFHKFITTFISLIIGIALFYIIFGDDDNDQ